MRRLIPFLEGEAHPTTRLGRILLQLLGSTGQVYGAAQRLRTDLYRRGLLASYRAPCPVISVGNLTAGGTGKTPTVLWLARQFLARHANHHTPEGRRPTPPGSLAIVSRGYGTTARRHATNPAGDSPRQQHVTLVADPDGVRLDPPDAADEATLLARNLPGVVVLTGPDRARLIRFAVEQYDTRLIMMDDGFQHLRVQRDLDLVLVDAKRPLGNGAMLPGGVLREPPSALTRCDAMLITRADDPVATQNTQALLAQLAPGKPIFCAQHQPQAWVRLGSEQPHDLSTLAHTPVLAFCGIARPNSFVHLLETLNTQTTGFHAFPDHFAFSEQEMNHLIQKARATHAKALVCTEKDAVKISPSWLAARQDGLPLFFLRMDLVFSEEPTWIYEQLDRMRL